MANLTRKQREALYSKWNQNNQNMTYRQFRKTAKREICGNAIMIQWSGMWLGIEPDGHCHS